MVNGKETPASETGQSAFRFMVPIQKVQDLGLAETLHLNEDVGFNLAIHPSRRIAWYLCRK